MRCFCISDDPDVLTGMRLAGIEGARGFTSAVITAAEQHAARINEETEQLEREAIDNYAAAR